MDPNTQSGIWEGAKCKLTTAFKCVPLLLAQPGSLEMLSARVHEIQEECGVALSSPMARELAEDFPSEEEARAQVVSINAVAQPDWQSFRETVEAPHYFELAGVETDGTPHDQRYYAPFFYDDTYRSQTIIGVGGAHTSQVGYWYGRGIYEDGFGSEKLKVGTHSCTRDFVFGSCDEGGFFTSILTPSEWGCFKNLADARKRMATEEVAAYMEERQKVSARFGERSSYDGIPFETLLSYPERFNFEDVSLMHRAEKRVGPELAAAFDSGFSAKHIVYFVDNTELQVEQVNPYAFLAVRFSGQEIAGVVESQTPLREAQKYLAYPPRFDLYSIINFIEKDVSPSVAVAFDPTIEPLNIPWYREHGYTPQSISSYAPTLSELCSLDAEGSNNVSARQLMDLAHFDVPLKDVREALTGPHKDSLCAEENLGKVLNSGIPLKNYFSYPDTDPSNSYLNFSRRQSLYKAGISPAVAGAFPTDSFGDEIKYCLDRGVSGSEAQSWMRLGYEIRTACDFAASDLPRTVVRPFDNHFGPRDVEEFFEQGDSAETVNSFPDRFSGFEVEGFLRNKIGAAEVNVLPAHFSYRAVLAVHEDPSLEDKILTYPAHLDTDIVLDWIATGVSVNQIQGYPSHLDALSIKSLLKNDLLPEPVSPEVVALFDTHYDGWAIVQMVAAGIAPEVANDPRVVKESCFWVFKDHTLEELRPYDERFYFFGAAKLREAGVDSEVANAYPTILNGHRLGFGEVIELQKRGVQPKDKNLEAAFMELVK